MDRHEMEEKIRSAVAQATPDQLEDILAACEGDVGAPMPLPKATRRRPDGSGRCGAGGSGAWPIPHGRTDRLLSGPGSGPCPAHAFGHCRHAPPHSDTQDHPAGRDRPRRHNTGGQHTQRHPYPH